MNIAMLTERMKLGFGVDLVVNEQARRLAELGHKVTVFVIHSDGIINAPAYDLVVISTVLPGITDYTSRACIELMQHEIAKRDIDLCMLHTSPFYEWLESLCLPVIVVEYGTPPGLFFDHDTARHLTQMKEYRLNHVYGKLGYSDGLMSISASIHETLPKRVQDFSTVIHLGCDHYAPATEAAAAQFRCSLGIKNDECMILWVGRMQYVHDEQPYKGFKRLLAMIPDVKRRSANAKFVLLGKISAEDIAAVEHHDVILLPNVPAEKMGVAYAAADLLVNLSQWEGFNLALLEAQFQGTPVIAYEIGPHPEIVRNGHTGRLVKSDSELLQSICELASDPTALDNLSSNAKAFAAEFTWDISVAKLANVIQDCHRRSLVDGPIRRKDRLAAFGHETRLVSSPNERRDFATLSTYRKLRRVAGIAVRGARSHLRLPSAGWLRLPSIGGRGSPSDSVLSIFSLPEEPFIRAAYELMLGRRVEPEGLAYWSSRLRTGESKRSVLAGIGLSVEGRQFPRKNPALERIVRVQRLVHLPLIGPLFNRLGVGEERESLRKQLRRFESSQTLIAKGLAEIAANQGGYRTMPVRDWLHRQQSATVVSFSHQNRSNLPAQQSVHRITTEHVALLAPGVRLSTGALDRLADVARSSRSDLIFGDELLDTGPFEDLTLQARGLFSHDAFLSVPDLGGVVAVHDDVRRRAHCGETVALTGGVLLRLVACAHTITHIPAILAERSSDDTRTNNPTAVELQNYLEPLRRGPTLHAIDRDRFDVCYPAPADWKAALVIIFGNETDISAHSITETIRNSESFTSIVAHRGDLDPRLMEELTEMGKEYRTLQFMPNSTLGSIVNRAAREAPEDCNLLVVMDGNVEPTATDWLPRLAASCFRSEIGAVAPLSLYSDNRVSHAGIVIGLMGTYGHLFRFCPAFSDNSYRTRSPDLICSRDVSAVSAHCMALRRDVFLDQGGMDERLTNDDASVELCLRIRAAGLKILLDPRIIMRDTNRAPRYTEIPDLSILREKHARALAESDPFFSTLLSTHHHKPEPRLQHQFTSTVQGDTVWLPPHHLR
jgi:glycosyltransferase involved in cell wall biosynthesis